MIITVVFFASGFIVMVRYSFTIVPYILFGAATVAVKSPICVNNKYGRNAGHFTEYYGELFRFAQDCEKGYGDNVHVLKAKNMSEDDYQEDVVKENILDRYSKFKKFSGHQLNIAEFQGKTVIATDAKEYHCFFGE